MPAAPFSLTLQPEDPGGADALALLNELSEALLALTGDAGRSSFDPADVQGPGGLFVVARDPAGVARGCGALRPLEAGAVELKRMYAQAGTQGVGAAVLQHLEAEAVGLGYRVLRLSTRRINQRALVFYARHGYRPCDAYGRYVGRAESVCLEKRLPLR